MCAWGCKRKHAASGLGLKRLAAGATAAAFPHIEVLFYLFGDEVYKGLQGGVTWSLILFPIYAFIIAYAFQLYSKIPWKNYYITTLVCLFVSILFSMFTLEGIRPFAPILNIRFAFGLIHGFDLTILAIAILTFSLGWVLKRWQRDVSRVGFGLCLIYLLVMLTFYIKADSFADKYAEIFKLEVTKVHLLPQPISPLNWRVILETKDGKLHDTLINLFRTSEKERTDQSTRAARIDSLYKPLDKAVWRIYRRFGNKDTNFAKRAWISMLNTGSQFSWTTRYAVFKSEIKYNSNRCAMFKDLRFEGSRRDKKGAYLICHENNDAILYLSDASGAFSKLEMMY